MVHSSSRPTLEAIEAVLVTVETGSFSATAERLNITHGAVSRRVASVEAWVGVRLFRRHGRGVLLDMDANEIVEQLKLAVAVIDDSARHSAAPGDLEMLRISVVPSFARLLLLPHLAAIEGQPRDVHLEIEIDQRLYALSNARLAIRHGHGHWSGVHAVPLFSETLVPVAAPAIVNALDGDVSPERLLDYPLIIDMPDSNWKAWFEQHEISFRPRRIDRVFRDYDLALMAAGHGLGIVLMRHPFGAGLASDLGLKPVSATRITGPTNFFVVTQLGSRTPTVDRVARRIVTCMQTT